jgi:hypothetical protein
MVGSGVLWDVRTLCAVVPPAGLYGVVGTGVLWDVRTLCAVVPPPGLYGVVGTGVLWDVRTLCAVVPPAGLYGAWCPPGLCSLSLSLSCITLLRHNGVLTTLAALRPCLLIVARRAHPPARRRPRPGTAQR